jgi:hypothetical protein
VGCVVVDRSVGEVDSGYWSCDYMNFDGFFSFQCGVCLKI